MTHFPQFKKPSLYEEVETIVSDNAIVKTPTSEPQIKIHELQDQYGRGFRCVNADDHLSRVASLSERIDAQTETMSKVVDERNELRTRVAELQVELKDSKASGAEYALKKHNFNPEYIEGFIEEEFYCGKENTLCDAVLWEADQEKIKSLESKLSEQSAQLSEKDEEICRLGAGLSIEADKARVCSSLYNTAMSRIVKQSKAIEKLKEQRRFAFLNTEKISAGDFAVLEITLDREINRILGVVE